MHTNKASMPTRKVTLHARIGLRCRLHFLWAASAMLSACASQVGQANAPLYQQLGGIQNIETFSSQAIARASTDPRTSRSFGRMKLSVLQKSVSNYVCKVADGPCEYDGESMRNAHADLANTGSEFDALVQILREEMDAANVSTAAKNELLRRLSPTRRDIVVR